MASLSLEKSEMCSVQASVFLLLYCLKRNPLVLGGAVGHKPALNILCLQGVELGDVEFRHGYCDFPVSQIGKFFAGSLTDLFLPWAYESESFWNVRLYFTKFLNFKFAVGNAHASIMAFATSL